MKIRKIIFLILALVWMGLIFNMSDKPADESAAESGGLIIRLGEIFIPDFDNWDEAQRQMLIEKYDHPVRKAAHMTEYAILALLFVGAFYDEKRAKKPLIPRSPYFVAWLFATVYAASDEFHQTFIPGRSGEMLDVCIDSTGAIIGVFLAVLAIFVIKYFFNKVKV